MSTPPKFPKKILLWISSSAMVEDLLGDLEEVYIFDQKSRGPFIAKFNYWKHALSMVFSYAIRKRKRDSLTSNYYNSGNFSMWKSYFKISIRNLKKQKVFTSLNIVGFSMGMSVATLSLVLYTELTQFEKFHENHKSIYRVSTILEENGDIDQYASIPPALAEKVSRGLSGIENSVKINSEFRPIIKRKGESIRASGYFTEKSFFDIFNFEFEEGNAYGLSNPNSIVITKELATKIFGKRGALGEVLETENYGDLKIVGVLTDFPKGTHLNFELVAGFSMARGIQGQNSNWTNFSNNYCYVVMPPGQYEVIQSQLNQIGKEGEPLFAKKSQKVAYEIVSILDLQLGIDFKNELGGTIGLAGLLSFFLISLLILIPACFNYTNMSIAKSLSRSKEIGIRKMMGSHRRQIIEQLVVETIIICLISSVFSIYIFHLIRTEFLGMLVIGKSLTFDLSPMAIGICVSFAVTTGLITGIIPAIYYAKVSPLHAVKNTMSDQKISVSGIRKSLMVLQFISTLVLMSGIGILVKQYQHALTFNFGFDAENVLVIPTFDQDTKIIRNSYMANRDVTEFSFTSSLPGTPVRHSEYLLFPEKSDSIEIRILQADQQFTQHMDLELVWGNHLSDRTHQIEHLLVNEKLMEKIKTIRGPNSDSILVPLSNGKQGQIVGVLKNYNYEPLDRNIAPLMVRVDESSTSYALVTIASQNLVPTITNLEITWDSLFPDIPFESHFLNDKIDESYAYFKIYMKIFGFLASMAITISCLGLIGMVIYTTQNRTKEVAIRKVLGANKSVLIKNLSNMYLRLWTIAVIIAMPLSYLGYDQLIVPMFNKFSGGVGMIEMVGSVLVTLIFAGTAIFWQINRTANVNPVDNLRNE